MQIYTEGLSDNDIKVTYKLLKDEKEIDLEKEKDVIESGKTRDIVITVTWDKDSKKSKVTLDEFKIYLNYEQYTGSDENNNEADTLSFPEVSGKLGDNVTFRYYKIENNNYGIAIEGTGDMYDPSFENLTYCKFNEGLDRNNCTLGNEIAIKVSQNLNVEYENDELKQIFTKYLSYFIVGADYEFLGMSKGDFKEYIIEEEAITDSQANWIVEIIDNVPKIESLTIENGVTSLRKDLFALVVVPKLILPNTINKTIGNGTALVVCQIDEITIEEGINTLSKGILEFGDVTIVQSIIIPEGVEKIEEGAIDMPTMGKRELIIPSTVTTIEKNAISPYGSFTIINKTKKAFDWNGILGNEESDPFETGTVTTRRNDTVTITNN